MGFLVLVFLHKNEIISIKLGFADFTHWGGIIAALLYFFRPAPAPPTRAGGVLRFAVYDRKRGKICGVPRYNRKGVARYNRENTGFTVKCDGTATDPHGTLQGPRKHGLHGIMGISGLRHIGTGLHGYHWSAIQRISNPNGAKHIEQTAANM